MFLITLALVVFGPILNRVVDLKRKFLRFIHLVFDRNVMNRIVHRYQNDSVFFFELLLWRTHPEWKCCLVCKERRLVVNYFLGFKLRRVSIASVDLCLLGNDVSC